LYNLQHGLIWTYDCTDRVVTNLGYIATMVNRLGVCFSLQPQLY